jgi:hypothetical protein
LDEIDEAELVSAGQRGVVCASAAGVKRAVPAALLRKCCHELTDQIDPRGLRLVNAVVIGCLDLAGMVVPFPLRFEGCEFDSAPVVEGAELSELSLTGCPRLPGLLGNGLRLRRDLDLTRSRVQGAYRTSASTSRSSAIWLCESEIGGRLLGVGSTIDGQGDRSIQADRIHVGGAVRLIHQFAARGEIRLIGARIDGSVDLTGAQLESSDGPAIDLEDATVHGSVFLIEDPAGHRPYIRGRFDMASAHISRRLLIRNATIEAHADAAKGSLYVTPTVIGTAVSAARLSVGAEVMLAGRCEVTGRIDMSMGDMSSVSIGENCVLRAPWRTALDLTNAEIRSLLRVDEKAAIEGTVRLAGAVIHGTLALHGQSSQPEHLSLIGGSAMTVDGDVYLNGLRTSGGQVNFRGATLGSLHAGGAQLNNPRGSSLHLSAAVVKGPVRLANGFTSTGRVALNRTLIEGRLQLTGGSFHYPEPAPGNKHGHAIVAISATVRGGMDLGWAVASPSVDFTDTTTTSLAVSSWRRLLVAEAQGRCRVRGYRRRLRLPHEDGRERPGRLGRADQQLVVAVGADEARSRHPGL